MTGRRLTSYARQNALMRACTVRQESGMKLLMWYKLYRTYACILANKMIVVNTIICNQGSPLYDTLGKAVLS